MKQQKMMCRRGIMVILVAITMLFIGVQAGVAAETYKVGVLHPFTGIYANYGEECLAAIQAYADDVNAKGGILGRKIEIVKRDEMPNPAAAVRATRDLILRDKVDAIIGTTTSSGLLGVLEVTKEHKIIHISSGANTERSVTENVHPYFFQQLVNTYMESQAVAKYLAKQNFKTWAFMGLDYEWPQNTNKALTELMPKYKPDAQKVGEFWAPMNETNFNSYVTAILNKKPDYVVGVLAGSAFQSFIRQAKGYDFFKKVTWLSNGYESEVIPLGKEFPEGVKFWDRGPFWGVSDSHPGKAILKKAILNSSLKRTPGLFGTYSYDAMICLTEAIKKAGSFDRDKIARALEGTKFDLLRGKDLYFRSIDHQMNSPQSFGTSVYDAKQGFCVAKDGYKVPGEEIWRPEAEVKKIRAEKNITFVPWSERK